MQGFTQGYVAMKLEISHTAYAKIERGETMLNQKKLAIICEVLGIEEHTLKTFDKSIYFKSKINV